MLSDQYTKETVQNRHCLTVITENSRFLAHQGIALRGDGAEHHSNFTRSMYMYVLLAVGTYRSGRSAAQTSTQAQMSGIYSVATHTRIHCNAQQAV